MYRYDLSAFRCIWCLDIMPWSFSFPTISSGDALASEVGQCGGRTGSDVSPRLDGRNSARFLTCRFQRHAMLLPSDSRDDGIPRCTPYEIGHRGTHVSPVRAKGGHCRAVRLTTSAKRPGYPALTALKGKLESTSTSGSAARVARQPMPREASARARRAGPKSALCARVLGSSLLAVVRSLEDGINVTGERLRRVGHELLGCITTAHLDLVNLGWPSSWSTTPDGLQPLVANYPRCLATAQGQLTLWARRDRRLQYPTTSSPESLHVKTSCQASKRGARSNLIQTPLIHRRLPPGESSWPQESKRHPDSHESREDLADPCSGLNVLHDGAIDHADDDCCCYRPTGNALHKGPVEALHDVDAPSLRSRVSAVAAEQRDMHLLGDALDDRRAHMIPRVPE